ncbi:hypothetical protein OPKNFCMD_6152 [Methylobacterium crusticola]|uniref:Uncharacterized protein n=1 Tax=Methylobacterium crusticola TaxID=1697972 RepID=A0ABQ4R9I1_9HYPH|nr:hypothetical protein [Methylobacterium crusticola]GJD53377.1 hypothetical protein OPKNFCMD_6152 [Methylobacterium crusticola]
MPTTFHTLCTHLLIFAIAGLTAPLLLNLYMHCIVRAPIDDGEPMQYVWGLVVALSIFCVFELVRALAAHRSQAMIPRL